MKPNRIFIEFVMVIVASALSIGGTMLFYNYSNKTQYVDYVVYRTESMLSVEGSIFSDTIDFRVNGNKVNDVSELNIYFINESSTDFEDLPIVIEFHQPDDFEILAQNALDQDYNKDLIEPFGLESSKYVRFGYRVKIMNRRGINPVFSLKYLIKGKSIPEFKIYTRKAGIEARLYDAKSKTDFLSVVQSTGFFTVAILIVGIIWSIFFLNNSFKQTELRFKEMDENRRRDEDMLQKLDELVSNKKREDRNEQAGKNVDG